MNRAGHLVPTWLESYSFLGTLLSFERNAFPWRLLLKLAGSGCQSRDCTPRLILFHTDGETEAKSKEEFPPKGCTGEFGGEPGKSMISMVLTLTSSVL